MTHHYTEHEPTGPRLGVSCADCTTLSRFDLLDTHTLDTLLAWYQALDSEALVYVSDETLALEIENTIRSRMPEHAFAPTQYSGVKGGSCGFHWNSVTCGKPRQSHETYERCDGLGRGVCGRDMPHTEHMVRVDGQGFPT